MKNNKKKGFTLVELVVVIAVIAILAGVLIGTFTSVISRANQSKAVQEWKAAVDEAYVEYVAEYKKTPTSVKVEGKTITFGGTEVYADDRFVGFNLLDEDGFVTLDNTADQQVYLNWDLNDDKTTYSVATTKTVDKDLLPEANKFTTTYEEEMRTQAQTKFTAYTGTKTGIQFIVTSGSKAFQTSGDPATLADDAQASTWSLSGTTLTVGSTIYTVVEGTPAANQVEVVAPGIYKIEA